MATRRRRYRRNDAAGTAEMLLGVAVAGGAAYLLYQLFEGAKDIAGAVPDAVAALPGNLATTAEAGATTGIPAIFNPPAGTSVSDYLTNAYDYTIGMLFGGPPVAINTPQGTVSQDPLLNTAPSP